MMTHITANEIGASPSGKTKRWMVFANIGSIPLGIVSWYAPWRCYCFNPQAGTVFEQTCLRDLANLCEIETKKRKLEREA